MCLAFCTLYVERGATPALHLKGEGGRGGEGLAGGGKKGGGQARGGRPRGDLQQQHCRSSEFVKNIFS